MIAVLAVCFITNGCTNPSTTVQPGSVSSPQPSPSYPPASRLPSPSATSGEQQEIPAGPLLGDRYEVQTFVRDMVNKHGFAHSELSEAFYRAYSQPAILRAMAKPYEAKPWYAYRRLFFTDKRLKGGHDFLADHASTFDTVEARYGVSRAIITAIIGIESAYGQKPGNYRVLESLSTLAFDYPKRAAFFRSELEQFLLLCREEGMDYLGPVGSYAGAMGMPQFMPSSYRKLAADGNSDGKKNIWTDPADAIASVARYFSKNGWRTGEPIAVRASIDPSSTHLAKKQPTLSYTLDELTASGVHPQYPMNSHLKAGVVVLDGENGPDYWIVFHNFNVIMRYNHSPLYAMAAYEVSHAMEGND